MDLNQNPINTAGTKEAFSTGSQRDSREGKGRFDLVSPIVLERDAKLLESGAKHYGERNWEKGQPVSRFMDSALRHINKHREGHRDEDHLTAARWNLAAIIHVEEMVARGKLPKELLDMPSYMPLPLYVGTVHGDGFTIEKVKSTCVRPDGVCMAKVGCAENCQSVKTPPKEADPSYKDQDGLVMTGGCGPIENRWLIGVVNHFVYYTIGKSVYFKKGCGEFSQKSVQFSVELLRNRTKLEKASTQIPRDVQDLHEEEVRKKTRVHIWTGPDGSVRRVWRFNGRAIVRDFDERGSPYAYVCSDYYTTVDPEGKPGWKSYEALNIPDRLVAYLAQ